MGEERLFRQLFTPFILLIIAYEWIVSGVDKIFNPQFIQLMTHEVLSTISGIQFPFYASFLKHVVVPHAAMYARLIEIGELGVGLGFLCVAVCLFRNKLTKSVRILGIWTGILSSFMVINFFFLKGGDLFINPRAIDEGVSMNFILFLVQLWVAIFFYSLDRKLVLEERFHDEYAQ